MAILVVEFSRQGYKIGKVFAYHVKKYTIGLIALVYFYMMWHMIN
jgi:hypothetical protein